MTFEEQPWLATTLGQVASGVIVLEASGRRLLFCNEPAARTWPGFLPAPSGFDIVVCQLVRSDGHPYTDGEWPLARSLMTGTVVVEDVQFVAENGTQTTVNVRCIPLLDEQSGVSAVAVILRDGSDRQQVEQALKASQARYENLYQHAPDMFASVAVDTEQIVQCNQTLTKATGYARDDLIGRSIRWLHGESCWPGLEAALDQMNRTGRVRDTELQMQCKNGDTLEVSLSMAAVRDEQDSPYFRLTWRDITERKRALAALGQKQAELKHSRLELQALAGRLLTVQEDERRRISRELHDDLNQRLALLAVEIEALHQQLPQPQRTIAERLCALRDGVVQLSDAVHELAYKLHASALDDLGLSTALRSYLLDYQRRESIAVEFNVTDLAEQVPIDTASCLYHVALEALRNAARHSGATQVTVSLEPSDEGVSMAIADDGVGFDVSSARGAGSRLGIVGMQERVRLVDGRFSLVSRPDEGTHIGVWVPVTMRRCVNASSDSTGR